MSENGQPLPPPPATKTGMPLDADTCYRALCARDPRFDGVFYVAVSTTGIYCRPVCPARPPAQERCAFYVRAAEAERAGFRACFRCRPELAPGLSSVDAVSRLARAAAARIDAGYLNRRSVDDLATALGVTARHLRRAMETELGVSPVELAQTKRLGLAKQLIQDSAMPLSDVAYAAGFSSIRRFDAVFQERFGRPPSALRRAHTAGQREGEEGIPLRLDYRPPLDWGALLRFLHGRAIPGVEQVEKVEGEGTGVYRRSVRIGDSVGWVVAWADPRRSALQVRVSSTLAGVLMDVVVRLRALFDLDARPELIAAHLGPDPVLGPAVAARPGLRVPGAFDPFEMAVRAILGQQVSVQAATTLAGRLVARFGTSVEGGFLFPTAAMLAAADVADIRSVGLTATRAATVGALARAIDGGAVELTDTTDPERTIAALQTLPGIGPWTAHYLGMRALRWPDAFPAGDLVICKALGVSSARGAEQRAAPWRPWRAYAAMYLWNPPSPTPGE